jgi:hypothetical protein
VQIEGACLAILFYFGLIKYQGIGDPNKLQEFLFNGFQLVIGLICWVGFFKES